MTLVRLKDELADVADDVTVNMILNRQHYENLSDYETAIILIKALVAAKKEDK